MRSLLIVGAAFAASAGAQQRPPASPLLDALAQCLPIRVDAERLACLDAAAGRLVAAARTDEVVVVTKAEVKRSRRSLFGLAVDENDVFPGRAAAIERIEQLDTTITNAIALGNGRWTLVLKEGGHWQNTEPWEYDQPRSGMAVTVRRGAMGSYRLSAKGQRTVRVERIN